MSSNKIDERVVAMKFQNSQFQSGVTDTLSSLDKLKAGLKLDGATKGLNELSAAGKGFNLGNIADGIANISSKFSALGIIGVTALANIANQAVNAGKSMLSSLTLDPIMSGFNEYELKMGSIQTILANTSRYGTQLPQVTASLDELNTYADKTIYNFGDMTKNIGLFTNAGIRIEDATSMIKGFSNAAAASGTSAEGASGAAYQLSQALSAGKITLMDWRSLTNVGMGNKNMQTGIVEIADAMGTLKKAGTSAKEVQTDFNGSLEKGWLKADVMSKYLKIMAQDNYDAAKAMAKSVGLSDEQADVLAKQAVTANEAATKVRTFTQLVGTMREAVGSSWTDTWGTLLGNFDEATTLFTNVNNTLGDMIAASGKARNDILSAWASQGGRAQVIEAIANAFKALMAIMKPITDAFREIFPPITVAQLLKMTQAILDFSKALMPSAKVLEDLKSTAKGFFALLDIGRMIIVQVFELFGRLFGQVASGGDNFLSITAKLGDFLVKVRDAIKNGDGLTKFFEKLGDVLQKPLDLIKQFAHTTIDIVSVDSWGEAWQKVANGVKAVYDFIKPAIDWVVNGLRSIKDAVKGALKEANPEFVVGSTIAAFGAGALAGVAILIKKLVTAIKNGISVDLTGGLAGQIKDVFGSVTDTLGAMQQKLKSETLIKIATAIAVLAAAVLILSLIDPVRLATALGAITVMMGQMAGMLKLLEISTKSFNTTKMAVIGVALILLATSMVILAAAITILANLDWNELARGLTGAAVGMGIMIGSVALLAKIPTKDLAKSVAALLLLAAAMVIMASALKIMASISWQEMAVGMGGLAVALGIMIGSIKLLSGEVAGIGALVLVAGAMLILSGALKILGSMHMNEIVKGLIALGGSLAIMAVTLSIMDGTLVGSAALVVAAIAITILAGALKIMATMSWDDIGRTMVVLAGGLLILAAAMALMGVPLVLLGAVGLLAASVALMAIAPALVLLGTMSWDAIGRGLTVLAAALVIMAVAGVLLLPAIPGLLGLGGAIALIGIGALAAGIGITLFAAGLLALSAAGAAALAMIGPAVAAFAAQIPVVAAAIAQGVLTFATIIGENAPVLITALTNVLLALIAAIIAVIPAIIAAAVVLITALVNAIVKLVPMLVDAGMKLIIGILDGIGKNIQKVVEKGTDIIVNFMNGIGKAIPRLLQAGAQLILDFINGLADTIRRNTDKMNAAGANLLDAIVDGMTSGIRGAIGKVGAAAKKIADAIPQGIKDFLHIKSPSRVTKELGMFAALGLAKGIDENADKVQKSSEGLGGAAVDGMKSSLRMLSDAINMHVDTNPVIAPVLDLTDFKRNVATVQSLIPTPSLSLDTVNTNAKLAAAGYDDNQRAKTDADGALVDTGSTLNFTQINNSPKALSPAEIYRQTKSQLSIAKEDLDK